MSKTITLNYENTEYILEYTRRTVSEMERKGFIATEIADKPMTTLPELFAGAFRANHRSTDRKVIDEIFKKLTNKEELISKLAEMYNEPILALVEEPEQSEGNLEWTANG
jgi:hypothetical protein